jgi:hypothetical protein
MTHIACTIPGCACTGGASLSPWRGACGKASASRSDPWSEGVGLERIQDGYSSPPQAPRSDRMGFGALTVDEGARGAPGIDWAATFSPQARRQAQRIVDNMASAGSDAISSMEHATRSMQAGTARIHALESDNATLRAVIATLEQQAIIVQADLREADTRIARALEVLKDRATSLISAFSHIYNAVAILRGDPR